MIHRLIRALLALGGSVLLYMAFFLYENERGQIQNRLEELWIAIDDQARKVPGKNAAFLREIVGIASATFDRFFGKKILSWRSVAVSACFSIASYAISCAAFAVSNSSFGRSGRYRSSLSKRSTGSGLQSRFFLPTHGQQVALRSSFFCSEAFPLLPKSQTTSFGLWRPFLALVGHCSWFSERHRFCFFKRHQGCG